MAQNTQEKDTNPELDNVDQIREILFGSQSRALEDRFERIEKNIKSIHNEMRMKFEQSQNAMDDKLNNEVQNIIKKMNNISSLQQDNVEEIEQSTIELQKQQLQIRNELHTQIDTLQDKLLKVIDTKSSEFNDGKLSRDRTAEILMEAAMAIKSTQINQKSAAESK